MSRGAKYRLSRRNRLVRPFQVMEILEEAMQMQRAGVPVIHMEVGEPDFPTPEPIRRAACQALERGHTGYTHSLGLPQLREAVAAHYRREYGVPLDSSRVVITAGTSPAMLLAFAALLNPGEQVIISNPAYACYPNFIRHAGGEVVRVNIYEQEGYQLLPEKLRPRLGRRTKAVLLNSPANPTGALLSPEILEQLVTSAPFVLSDEIYHGLVYGGKARSVLEFSDRAIVFNGFSKLYAMTGWRLGYLIAPRELIRPIQILQQNFFICPNNFVQWAGVAALTEAKEQVAEMVTTFARRRQCLLQELRRLGLGPAYEPQGAFYVLVDTRPLGWRDSLATARDILNKVHLALAPGADFGSNAEGFLRFSYSIPREKIKQGMQRLAEYLRLRGK